MSDPGDETAALSRFSDPREGATRTSRFLTAGRPLTPEDNLTLAGLKRAFARAETSIEALPPGRHRAMAMDDLERAYTMSVRALTEPRD